jgi:hypothetical protein
MCQPAFSPSLPGRWTVWVFRQTSFLSWQGCRDGITSTPEKWSQGIIITGLWIGQHDTWVTKNSARGSLNMRRLFQSERWAVQSGVPSRYMMRSTQ